LTNPLLPDQTGSKEREDHASCVKLTRSCAKITPGAPSQKSFDSPDQNFLNLNTDSLGRQAGGLAWQSFSTLDGWQLGEARNALGMVFAHSQDTALKSVAVRGDGFAD